MILLNVMFIVLKWVYGIFVNINIHHFCSVSIKKIFVMYTMGNPWHLLENHCFSVHVLRMYYGKKLFQVYCGKSLSDSPVYYWISVTSVLLEIFHKPTLKHVAVNSICIQNALLYFKWILHDSLAVLVYTMVPGYCLKLHYVHFLNQMASFYF